MIGPCAKATVRCTIIAPDGRQYVGEIICRQVGHAEIVAAYLAGDRAVGGIAYIEGHTYACEACKVALAAIGVTDIRIDCPPGAAA